MSDPKFITVHTIYGSKTIAIDNIAMIEPFVGSGSTITLKQVKDGNNVEVLTTASVSEINRVIADVLAK